MPDNNSNQKKQKQYEEYVKTVTPVHSLPINMCKAFFTGGFICVLGQIVLNCAGRLGLDKDTAGSWCSLILILLSVILTGCNLYSKIGIGCKIFTIAGPVILYGILSSWILGVIYYLFMKI